MVFKFETHILSLFQEYLWSLNYLVIFLPDFSKLGQTEQVAFPQDSSSTLLYLERPKVTWQLGGKLGCQAIPQPSKLKKHKCWANMCQNNNLIEIPHRPFIFISSLIMVQSPHMFKIWFEFEYPLPNLKGFVNLVTISESIFFFLKKKKKSQGAM